MNSPALTCAKIVRNWHALPDAPTREPHQFDRHLSSRSPIGNSAVFVKVGSTGGKGESHEEFS